MMEDGRRMTELRLTETATAHNIVLNEKRMKLKALKSDLRYFVHNCILFV